jgi:LacI family transcriptional regulator
MEDTTSDTGYRALRQALEQHPETTAVFAINDAMAMGALRAAQDMGRSLPGDLAVVGFDDVVAAAHVCPSLTTMRVPKRQLGVLAARRLVERLRQENGDTEAAVVSMVNAELVLRASCGCEEKP